MSDVQPFDYVLAGALNGHRCDNVNCAYEASVLVPSISLRLCGVCLRRTRATLKAALKEWEPKQPKVQRPKEEIP